MESSETPSAEIQEAVDKAVERNVEIKEKAKEEGRAEERRERWHDEEIDHLHVRISALEEEKRMLRAEHDALVTDYLEEIGAMEEEEETPPEEAPAAETPAAEEVKVEEKVEEKPEGTTLPPKPEGTKKKGAWARMWGED